MPNLRSIYKADRFEDLPLERTCNHCGETKPREQMIIQHRSSEGPGYYYFRPKCKECNNEHERGHRREYKRNYLRNWRRGNPDLERSYWDNPQAREAARVRATNFTAEQKDAIAIQRRLRKRGEQVTIAEARELLSQFGRCYPTQFGLTKQGKRECERIRARLRVRSAKSGRRVPSTFSIRLMVYEMSLDEAGLVIPPDEQPTPYQYASERLRQFHRNQRIVAGERRDDRSFAAAA